jgi:hypothetical protein
MRDAECLAVQCAHFLRRIIRSDGVAGYQRSTAPLLAAGNAMPSPFDQLDTAFRGRKHGFPMASVYQVDALVRQRPGISLDELRKALGPDVSRPLKRLEVLGYIRRVESTDRPTDQYRVR